MKKTLVIVNGILSNQRYFADLDSALTSKAGLEHLLLMRYEHFSLLPYKVFDFLTERKAVQLTTMIRRINEADMEISILGHSHGTDIAKRACDILYGDVNNKNIKIKSLFLAGSVLPLDTKFSENIENIICFYSEKDWVLRLPFYGGTTGRFGLDCLGDMRKYSYRFECGHSDYMHRGPLFDMTKIMARFL